VTLGINLEQASGRVEVGVMANGGEDIHGLALVCGGVTHSVGGDDGQTQRCGDAKGDLVSPFFAAFKMALNLYVDVVAAVDTYQLLYCSPRFGFAIVKQGCGERAFFAAG
jgi:hypothetical protein